jgi:hypothetical protein
VTVASLQVDHCSSICPWTCRDPNPTLIPIPTGGFPQVLCCTVLYFAALCCTLLHCAVLYCTVLYRTVVYCGVLYSTVLYCTVMYPTGLYCTVLYCTVLYCTILMLLRRADFPSITPLVVTCRLHGGGDDESAVKVERQYIYYTIVYYSILYYAILDCE